jgi:nucleotide-binding universal stress UspA family protein
VAAKIGDTKAVRPPQNILVAFDGSTHARRALEEAVALAQADDARLTLVSVVHRPDGIAGPYVAPSPAFIKTLVHEAEGDLARAAASIPEGVAVTTIVRVGDAAEEILELADKNEHDLVVVGTRGHSELASLALGRVSHALLRRASAPVLVARAAAAA